MAHGPLLALAVLVLPLTARAGTASVVANLKSEQAECDFLRGLCRTANRTARFAADTPLTGQTEVLATRHAREAEMHVQDALEAGQAITAKHGGRKLACFDDPECEFVRRKLFP
jgi:hypothetical protein